MSNIHNKINKYLHSGKLEITYNGILCQDFKTFDNSVICETKYIGKRRNGKVYEITNNKNNTKFIISSLERVYSYFLLFLNKYNY